MLTSPHHFSLKWNNYTRHITTAFDDLRRKDDFVDCTVSCEDKRIKAHKMVLSACSPYFKEIFKENPCQHPVIIVKGILFSDLVALVDFMYKGEVRIHHQQLQSFMKTAELLKILGLTETIGDYSSSDIQDSTVESTNGQSVQVCNSLESHISTPTYFKKMASIPKSTNQHIFKPVVSHTVPVQYKRKSVMMNNHITPDKRSKLCSDTICESVCQVIENVDIKPTSIALDNDIYVDKEVKWKSCDSYAPKVPFVVITGREKDICDQKVLSPTFDSLVSNKSHNSNTGSSITSHRRSKMFNLKDPVLKLERMKSLSSHHIYLPDTNYKGKYMNRCTAEVEKVDHSARIKEEDLGSFCSK